MVFNFFDVKSMKSDVLPVETEYEFEFKLSADEYFAVINELRSKDEDVIDVKGMFFNCSRANCKKMFKTRKLFREHERRHERKEHVSFCHVCGINIKGNLERHISRHE